MKTLKLFGTAVIVAPFILQGCAKKAETPDRSKMNILFIAIEDWSTEAIGCYGNKIVKTPNVDALAAKGIMFTRAYCSGPVCNPSRASIATGMRQDSHKVFGNPDDFDKCAPDGLPFIADMLKKNGAHTAQLGKLMHKWKYTKTKINTFDQVEYEKPFATNDGEIIDTEDYRDFYKGEVKYRDVIPSIIPEIPKRDWVYVPNREVDNRMQRLAFVRDSLVAAGVPDSWDIRKPFQQMDAEQIGNSGFLPEQYEDGILARVASEMLKDYAKSGNQFFLNIGFYAPHTPLLAPEKYVKMYENADIQISPYTADKDNGVPMQAKRFGHNYDIFNGLYPEYAPTEKRQKEAIAAYYACGTYVDDQVGILLNTLENTGLDKNTIVILWADHGFHLGEHGLWSKFTLFEQSTKAPLIVYVPGAKGNGKKCDEIVELVDMLPTMCDLWNVPKDSRFESTSFAPLLDNPELPWKEAAFSICPKPVNGRSVRTKQYKYAEYFKKETDLPGVTEPNAVELYDLFSDPYEQTNLAGKEEYQETQAKLKQMLIDGWSKAVPK